MKKTNVLKSDLHEFFTHNCVSLVQAFSTRWSKPSRRGGAVVILSPASLYKESGRWKFYPQRISLKSLRVTINSSYPIKLRLLSSTLIVSTMLLSHTEDTHFVGWESLTRTLILSTPFKLKSCTHFLEYWHSSLSRTFVT